MSLWTSLRDTLESAAVVAGNYFLPGSSIVTSNLVSEGSKDQLNSTVGKLAQLGSGGYGAFEGNLANYGNAYDKVASAFGGSANTGLTGQQAIDAFNAGKISAAELEALANGAGTTTSSLLSGVGASKYLIPAATLASGLFSANAAQKAATTQAEAQSQANQLMYGMYKEQQARQEPWYQAGQAALNKLIPMSDYKPFTYDAMTADPGYAFRLSEGQKALERSAAARGGLLSGATGKNLLRYGQEMGSQEYQNAFNRYQTERNAALGPLQTLAGYGQNSANTMTSAAGTYGSNAAGGITDVARAQASGTTGSANALTTALNNYMNYSANQDIASAIRRSTYA